MQRKKILSCLWGSDCPKIRDSQRIIKSVNASSASGNWCSSSIFWVVKFSEIGLCFRGITDYLYGLFLRVRVSDCWWWPVTPWMFPPQKRSPRTNPSRIIGPPVQNIAAIPGPPRSPLTRIDKYRVSLCRKRKNCQTHAWTTYRYNDCRIWRFCL